MKGREECMYKMHLLQTGIYTAHPRSSFASDLHPVRFKAHNVASIVERSVVGR
jgi:hypothetical protein